MHVETVPGHLPAGAIVVPDAQLLFTGDFKRSGVDLILSKDDRELVLRDYFKGEKHAALASPDGAHLTGDIVDALTGHTQFAQADGSTAEAKVIGHVTKLLGTATAIRNGVAIILNQGDNVNKGDVVQSGSDSTLGITFIDGTVFGLGSNAKMVLNEMIYDPNGSNNSSLLSLVQGTISFVAGATAKHGDMKVDTPVATMGIRGTAVLVEIDFEVPGQGGAPPAKFQVLVEPDGTSGSYILFDKTTLNPIATVNVPGTQTIINGQGTVNFLSSVQLSADAQKIINDVFALKFTDNNSNTKLTNNFTDSIVPTFLGLKLGNGDTVPVTVFTANAPDKAVSSTSSSTGKQLDHIPGPPDARAFGGAITEHAGLTHSASTDTASNKITFVDINAGDLPSATAKFDSFSYKDAGNHDVTASLTAEQLAAIAAVEVPLQVLQTAGNNNNGSATWSYSIADSAFDFLAAGETLTLTYLARVDNNYALNNETTFVPFTITITGTNDAPTIATSGGTITERIGTGNTAIDRVSGTVTFTDVDLTDRPVVSAAISSTDPFKYIDAQGHDVTSTLTPEQKAAIAAVEATLSVVQAAGNTHDGSATWTYSVVDKSFDFIAKGETLILNYVAEVDDGHGGVVATPITVSINGADVSVTGTNDVPDITSGPQTGTIRELADTLNASTLDHAQGAIAFTDPDLTDTHAVTITGVSASGVTSGLAGNATVLGWLSLGTLTDSTDGVTGSRPWTFSAADKSFDYLAAGETLKLTYTVQVDDHHGGVVSQPVTITITGTNDAPVVDTDVSGTADTGLHSITERPDITGDSSDFDSSGGTPAFTDVDLSDTHTIGDSAPAFAWSDSNGHALSLSTIQQNALTTASLFGLTLHDSTGTGHGSVDFSYSAADSSFDFLAAGETLTVTYDVIVTDNNHVSSTKPVTITITGTNDAPVAVADSDQGHIVEAGNDVDDTVLPGVPTTTGNVLSNDTDVDLTDTHDVVGVVAGTVSGILSGGVGTAITGTYGSLLVNADGTWTYTLDNNNPATNALAQGAHVDDVFSYTESDHHGGTSTTTLTVGIAGTNDAPTLADVKAGTLTDTAAADSFSDLTGTLVGSDVDTGETASLSYAAFDANNNPVTTAVAGHYGSLTVHADGSYDYVPDAAAIDALSVGAYTDTFTVETTDVHGATGTATLTVNVTGADDAPVIDIADLHVTANDDGTTTISSLSVTDADAASSEPFTLAASTAGADSGTSVNLELGTGLLADINATLKTGVTYEQGGDPPSTDMVTLTVGDGHGATDTVNLIFSVAQSPATPVTLVGTTGKDVFFGTGDQDQFVFAANSNHDTIMNFAPGQDHIDLSAAVTTSDASTWISQHVAASPTNPADTLITIDAADTIVLHNVAVASLTAKDFILHIG
jgi:VCBS repeat-containing protein